MSMVALATAVTTISLRVCEMACCRAASVMGKRESTGQRDRLLGGDPGLILDQGRGSVNVGLATRNSRT